MRQLLLILYVLVYFFCSLHGQQCAVQTFGSKDGIPTAPYTDFYQDAKGILWVSNYQEGLLRYDGSTWQNFTENNSNLLNNNCNQLIVVPNNGILINHDTKGHTLLKTDTFIQIPLLPQEKEGKWKRHSTITGRIIFFDYESKLLHQWDYETSSCKHLGLPPLPVQDSLIIHGIEEIKVTGAIMISSQNIKTGFYLVWLFKNGEWQNLYKGRKGADFFNINNFVIQRDEKGFIKMINDLSWEQLPQPYFTLFDGERVSPKLKYHTGDTDGNNLFLLYDLVEEGSKTPRFLLVELDSSLQQKNALVFTTTDLPNSGIIKDIAGTYWVGTGTSIVRIVPQILEMPGTVVGLRQIWGSAEARDGSVWLSSYGDGLAFCDGFKVKKAPSAFNQFSHFLDGCMIDTASGNMYFGVQSRPNCLLEIDGKGNRQIYQKDIVGYYHGYGKKGQILKGTMGTGLWVLPRGNSVANETAWKKIDKSKGLKLENVLCAMDDQYGRYWMGRTSQGIACYDPKSDKVYNWLKSDKKIQLGATSLESDKWGNLWFGTDRGLHLLKLPPEGIDDSFDLQRNLKPVGVEWMGESTVTICKLYNDSTLLLGNGKGFYFLDLCAYYQTHKTNVSIFDQYTGHFLTALGQNGSSFDRQKNIWLVGAEGALRFSSDKWLRDTSALTVKVDSILLGRTMHISPDSKELQGVEDGRLVRIWFSCSNNPLLFDNTRYRYRLTGDTTWSAPIKGRFFEIPYIGFGHFQFEVMAIRDGIESAPAVVRFYIPPVLWQNPLFWLTIIGALLVLGSILLGLYRKNKNQEIAIQRNTKEMESLSKEKTQLQVEAIVNQLNPHFINNALQWLQIRVDEDQEAVAVVGRLSENIAKVFKNSRQKKPFHSLKEELALTENYLYIQGCRFKKLKYEMPDHLNGLDEINVPMMMVQIHVENAVEHGIRNNPGGAGSVTVDLRDDDAFIVIRITDDGVGREKAKVFGSKGTQNGTKMLSELERIYNAQNENHISHLYEDGIYYNDEQIPFGTRVIINIPKIYNYSI
jgi:hypothetical protein